uniref:hypothetical protein n=1 Tax=Amycolatopsis sp. CA-096443 TaxID=3239919 RepID=UPI003F498155
MSIWATVITMAAMLVGVFAGGVLKGRADAVARAHEWQLKVVDVGGHGASLPAPHVRR